MDAPNFASGLPAAIACLAAHPSSQSTRFTILSLPLPLSSIANPGLSQVLSALSGELGETVTRREKDLNATWDENDDEPFTGPGMGGGKRGGQDGLTREDVGTMYM
jgi:hypothetical protein